MERNRGGNQDEIMSKGEGGGNGTKERNMMETSEEDMMRRKVDEEGHLKIYGGLREEIRMQTYLHGPMVSAKKLKLQIE